MRHALAAALLTLGMTSMGGVAEAQTRTTRIIVAFPPGGPIDLVARHIAEPMGRDLGTTVVVENKPGGNTLIAAQLVAGSPGDGSVVFLASMSTIVLNPMLYEKLPYNVERDFTPISGVASTSPVLVVHPSNTAADATAFAAAAKAVAAPIPIASAGMGGTTHISLELFAQASGAKLLHIPYKGAADAINDLLGNHVQGFFGDLPGVIGHIRAGKLKVLGVLANEPHPLLPGVKPMRAQGFQGLENENWYALYAPARTPADMVAKLNKAVHAALADAGVKAKLADAGAVIGPSTPEAQLAVQKADSLRMGALIKARGIKLE